MRILFWNTHRNVDINSYILDIVNQNEIDVLVLAEYMAEINELNDNLKQCKKRLFKQYIYDVDSMEELKTMFETIINTDFCTNLIQSLIYESMRQSRKDKSEN